jgi:hypothetical protein
MVVEQNLGSALLLHDVVSHGGAPADDGFFIAPTGQRKNPAFARQALIADVVDEPVDLLQFGPQHLCIVEVGVRLIRLRMHFEYHREQSGLLQTVSRGKGGSAADCSAALFAGFTATMAESRLVHARNRPSYFEEVYQFSVSHLASCLFE